VTIADARRRQMLIKLVAFHLLVAVLYAIVNPENIILFAVLGFLSVLWAMYVFNGTFTRLDTLQANLSRYRRIAESFGDMVTLHTPDGRFLYASPSYTDATGYSLDELKALSEDELMSLVHPEDVERTNSLRLHELAQGETITDHVFRHRRKDGSFFWVDAHSSPVYGKDGHFSEVVSIARNISKQKEIEDSLRRNEQRAKALLDALPDEVWRIAADGTILDVGGYYSDVIIRPEDAIGKNMHDLVPRLGIPVGLLDGMKTLMETALRDRQVHLYEYQLNLPGQGLHDFEARMVCSGEDEVTMIVRDITDHKQADKRQRDLTVELQTNNQELQNFAYIVSHDLRAPLRGVNTIASWLFDDYSEALDDDGKRLLGLLQGRVQRMDAMISGVLEYSRLGRDHSPAQVNLTELLADIMMDIPHDENCTISVDTSLPTVTADPIRIRQVFQNLIDNAIKFMDKPNGEIHVGCQQRESDWLFSINDNGPGIEERHFLKIFQIFQTLTPRDQVESTGIGLAIVKRILELYGGKIWVESTIGKGSTFYFTLPH
jgi:two-component system, LuxR family, sensor kinase FixL